MKSRLCVFGVFLYFGGCFSCFYVRLFELYVLHLFCSSQPLKLEGGVHAFDFNEETNIIG